MPGPSGTGDAPRPPVPCEAATNAVALAEGLDDRALPDRCSAGTKGVTTANVTAFRAARGRPRLLEAVLHHDVGKEQLPVHRQLAAREPRLADAADAFSSVSTNRKFRSPPHTGYVSMPVVFTRIPRSCRPGMVHERSAPGSPPRARTNRAGGRTVTLQRVSCAEWAEGS